MARSDAVLTPPRGRGVRRGDHIGAYTTARTVAGQSAVFELSLLRRTLCSKLHVDHVPLRVMVTYFGAGTEVLSQGASDAVARLLAPGARFVGEAAKLIYDRAEAIVAG